MTEKIFFTITGSSIGIFSYGRKILRQHNKANLKFILTRNSDNTNHLQEQLLDIALQKILTTTRFGRIGIMYDRKNFWAKKNLASLDINTFKYSPTDKRAVKVPEIHQFKYQVLRDVACEGLADSVEFRRLVRRYIRPAKQANCDTILLLDDIMGSDSAHKQWKAIAGTQRKIICLSDFILDLPEITQKKSAWEQTEKRKINIELDSFWESQKEFVNERADQILRTKLKSSKP